MKSASCILSLAASVLLKSGESASLTDCQWSAMNATFDLHPLMLEDGGQSDYYKVSDSRIDENGTETSFEYNFNICNQVIALKQESSCNSIENPGYCPENSINKTTGSCEVSPRTSIDGLGYAYQTNTLIDKCRHISGSSTSDMSFSLLDSSDPTRGVVLSYKNGDYCDSKGRNREFNIHFECENDAYNVPDEERVEEAETCQYNLTIKSIYGCPSECGTFSHSLCAAQGLCEYDWTNTKAKCFCYAGYSGNACDEYSASDATPDTKTPPEGDSDYVETLRWWTLLTDSAGITSNKTVDVTYDLTPFHKENGFYKVFDNDDRPFIYYFNVLDNVGTDDLPESCNDATGSCSNIADDGSCGDDLNTVNSVGAAFQYNNDSNKCNLVGTSDAYTWALLDNEDPAKGINLTYTTGGYCDEGANREFSLLLECPDSPRDYYNPTEVSVFSEFVDEDHGCSYSISLETALACPYECITDAYDNKTGELLDDQFQVCSGRGICAADPAAGIVRCLCDAGWSGSDCNTVVVSSNSNTKTNNTGFQVAIAVISIVLIAVVGLVVYYRMRLNSLQKNLQKQLLDEEEEDDMEVGVGNVAGTVEMNGQAHHDSGDEDDDDSGDDAGVGDQVDEQDDEENSEMVAVRTDVTSGATQKDDELVVEDLDDTNDL